MTDSPVARYDKGWLGTARLAENLAAFLLVRGPHAWFGWSWCGCVCQARGQKGDDCDGPPGGPGDGWPRVFPPAFEVDYGAPMEVCRETAAGVFERDWTKAHVRVDCTDWTSSAVTSGRRRCV